MAPRGLARRLEAAGRCLVVLAGLVAATAGASLAQAFKGQAVGPESGMRARVTYAWPVDTVHGYLPVKVELWNEGREGKRVKVAAEGSTYGRFVRHLAARELFLESGEGAELELRMPRFGHGQGVSSPWVVISAGGEDMRISQPSSGSGRSRDVLSILAVHGVEPPAGTNQALKVSLDAFSKAYGGPGALGGTEVTVGAATWSDLPSDWQAYSSLDGVVLSTADPGQLDEHLEPILAWVRMGGTLLLVGTASAAELGSVDLLEGAFGERSRVESSPDVFSYGLGRIRLVPAPFDWAASAWGEACVDQVLDVHIYHSDHSAVFPGRSLGPTVFGLRPFNKLPLRGYLVVLLAFVVVIGPLNLILIRRMRRPALLLLSIPALSALATMGIVGYGLLEQGLDLRVRDSSLIYLDQGRARVASLTARDLFAGGFASEGLRPGGGTGVFPMGDFSWDRLEFRVERGDDGVLLAGDFLPSRRAVRQAIVTEAASRLRIEVERSGSGLLVRNGTPEPIAHFHYKSLEGKWLQADQLAPGEEQALRAGKFSGSDIEALLSQRFLGKIEVPRGGYITEVRSNPFLDDLGMDAAFERGEVYLIGELAVEEAL